MKKLGLIILLASALILPVRAQLFSPEAWNGALLGTFFGGIAGSDCHHGFSGTGAAIGAGVGFLAGALAGEVNRRSYYASSAYPAYYYPPGPYVQPGYGYVYSDPAYVYATPQSGYVAGGPVAIQQPSRPPAPASRQKPTPRPASRPSPPAPVLSSVPQIPDAPRVPDAPTF